MDRDVMMFAHVMTVIVMSLAGFVLVGLGGRLLWRLGSRAPKQLDPAADRRDLQRLETAVESIAIEVERISESQRFMVSLFANRFPGEAGESATELPPSAAKRAITPQ